jgi:transglutaminase-like putative cysteine protease
VSVASVRRTGARAASELGAHVSPARILALGGVALLVGAYLSVLHEILVITGDPQQLYYVVAGAFVAGTLLARLISPRSAALLGAIALIAGTYLYVTSLPGDFAFLALLTPMVDDASALLGGLSVLRIINADVWALAAAPVPVFLAWYLGLRGRYVAAAAVGAAALGVVVLTGDATNATTLAGVAGATVAVAFGDCDRRDEPIRNADGVVVVLTAMVVLTLVIGAVPGATGALLSTEGLGFDAGSSTVESSLVYGGDSVAITGAAELSPEVRYTVEADREAYWRVGTYDRYTGGGWVRTGSLRSYQGQLRAPPGESEGLEQRYTAESDIATLPAANRPTGIDGVAVPVQVTEAGSFEPASPLQPGESYEIQSQVPVASATELRSAGTAYPTPIEDRYTQLPSSVPDRVAERTARLTANAGNPYDTARALEWWFHEAYDYSLDVERPRGNVADEFLFEMDAGYCTYFATTMVAMLRSQDIPARFAVGYTPGQQVSDDEWVVRGYDSHAWVEVYFPGHGWVEFDPTPSEPRESAERERLSDARDDGSAGDVDTNESRNSDLDEGTPRSTPTEGSGDPDSTPTPTDGTPGGEPTPGGAPADGGAAGGDDGGPSLPSIPRLTLEQVGLGLLVLAGAAVGARRSGAGSRFFRQVWLRRLPDGPPEAVVTGAYHRLVYLEERSGREKAPGETPRQFLAGADDRARRIGTLYERARYGPGVDAADAEEAARLLAALLAERSRLPHLVGSGDAESR